MACYEEEEHSAVDDKEMSSFQTRNMIHINQHVIVMGGIVILRALFPKEGVDDT
jgi:hypothetical protein